jgi:hypothetical protein
MKTRLLVALLVAACTSEPTGPIPGTLRVQLQDPNAGGDGAILVTLTGPAAPTNIVAAAGDTVWGVPFTGTTNSLVLTGHLANGVILSFDIPNLRVASQYTATVTQAAASSDYSLHAVGGYSLTVTP